MIGVCRMSEYWWFDVIVKCKKCGLTFVLKYEGDFDTNKTIDWLVKKLEPLGWVYSFENYEEIWYCRAHGNN